MAAPPAYILALSAPGEKVTEEEFNDWYDNEHIPRSADVPAFKSWARWVAEDGQTPKWAATYDLSSYEATKVPPFTTIPERSSEREKRILASLETLDIRTFELWQGPSLPPSALYDSTKAAPYTLFVSIDVTQEGEESFHRWYDEEHIPMLSKCPGWIRSRRFVLKESVQAGTQGAAGQKTPPRFLAVHEWAGMEWADSKELKAATSTSWRDEVMKTVTAYERKLFKLHKGWESRL